MKNKFLFLLLILFFLLTRLYKLGSIPSSVYWDEASIGYNAYSILKTGKDEWGEFLPLHFRAFGEFKLPVYIYSTLPFIYLFGLNEVSVRLPSVFYSLGSLILIYFIVNKLFRKSAIALLSSFLFAVLPWNFIFSRTGYEATAGLFFYLSFVFTWFYFETFDFEKLWFSGRKILIIFVFILSMIASFYSYNSFRFWTPLTFLFLIFSFYFGKRKMFLKNWRIIYFSFLLFLISFYPVYRLYRLDYGALRYQVVSLEGTLSEKVILFLKNYLSHFSFDFLFKNGDSNLRSQMPGFGQLYIISLPFLVLGLFCLLRRKDLNLFFLLFILLIAPVPSSITKESPHSLRAILFAFLMPVVASLGIFETEKIFKNNKKVILALIYISYLLSFVFYFIGFIKNYNLISASSWQAEYKQLFFYNRDILNRGEKIVVTDIYAQPYIFALFYGEVDPNGFRESLVYNSPDKWGFSTVYSFENFVFRRPDLSDLEKGYLIFSDGEIAGLENYLVNKIYLNNKVVFFVYRKQL